MSHGGHSHDHGHSHDGHSHSHDHAPESAPTAVAGFEVFGVPIAISGPANVVSRVETLLPPGTPQREVSEDDYGFILVPQARSEYRVEDEEGTISASSDMQVALEVLDSRIRACVARHAPEHIFIHAGVVAYSDEAIVIPGRSFSGKTTLVAELLQAGATYYSDEFAVLDAEGFVHPYAKPISLRLPGLGQTDHSPAALGGVIGETRLRIGLIVVTQFRPGAAWEPAPLSAGEALLALLDNAIPAQERPQQTLSTIKRAVEGADALQSERGDAGEVAAAIIDRMGASASAR